MHFYESMAHEKYSILKSCCRSNKTHQAAESTLCHHLHLGQARLQMQFPVWYLLSQMVSGKPGGDVLCSPHAVSSWFLFLCVCGGGGYSWQLCLTTAKYIQPKTQLGLFTNFPPKHNYLLSEKATEIFNQMLIRELKN